MSTVNVAGQSTDFTTDPNIILHDILKDNWPAGGASGDAELKKFDIDTNRSGVFFGTGWYATEHDYEIHVRPLATTVKTKTLGAQRWEYTDSHDIHIFARGNNGKDKLWKLEKEVLKQILLKQAQPHAFIPILYPTGPQRIPVDDDDMQLYHSVITVEFKYQKVKS